MPERLERVPSRTARLGSYHLRQISWIRFSDFADSEPDLWQLSAGLRRV